MILIAENLTAADPAIAAALAGRDTAPLRAVAECAARAGARYVDVNLGPRAGRDGSLDFALGVLGECWSGGVLIDSADPGALELGAAHAGRFRGGVVLNGFSGDPGREGALRVAERTGLPLVVLLMDRGIPKGADERLALAAELVGRCAQAGVPLERLWLDPVVAPLGWTEGQEYDTALLEVLRRLPEVFGAPVASVLGLSNLTTGSAGRVRAPWMQEVFLAAAAGAGLSHAMVDARNERLVRVARALEVFAGTRTFAPQEFASS